MEVIFTPLAERHVDISAQYIITHASEAKLNRPDAGRRSNADPVAIVESSWPVHYTLVWVTGGGGITTL